MANKTILDFPSASTPLNLTDILYLLQGSGTDRDRQTSLEALQDAIVTTLSPIGEIKQYDKSFPNTPAISANWIECDGGVILDIDSPYNTYRARNLNGDSVILTSTTWASGVATVAATDVTGLGLGDFVSGAGIAAGAYITDITGNVVTISDTAFSGTEDTTFTNDGRFVRGSGVSGLGQDHAAQAWQLGAEADLTGAKDYWGRASTRDFRSSSTAGAGQSFVTLITSGQGDAAMLKAMNDGVNGDIKSSAENRPVNTSLTFIMRIK
jgi:hypothetical protein